MYFGLVPPFSLSAPPVCGGKWRCHHSVLAQCWAPAEHPNTVTTLLSFCGCGTHPATCGVGSGSCTETCTNLILYFIASCRNKYITPDSKWLSTFNNGGYTDNLGSRLKKNNNNLNFGLLFTKRTATTGYKPAAVPRQNLYKVREGNLPPFLKAFLKILSTTAEDELRISRGVWHGSHLWARGDNCLTAKNSGSTVCHLQHCHKALRAQHLL